MRIAFIFLIALSFTKAKCQKLGDTIKWNGPEHLLKVSDFKHKPDKNSQYAAISNIARPAEWYTKHDTLFIRMNSEFIRGESWFNKERGDAASQVILLSHEQGHFDIGEIEVRKTKKQFRDNSNSINTKTFKSYIIKYFSEQGRNLERVNNLYDKETNFSTNIEKQKAWIEKLANELTALDQYKDDLMIIPLKK